MESNTVSPMRAAIVAMTRNNVIGLDGQIPWHYSEDLKRFKRRTLDSTIVMGRLTWESIGSMPLPRRRNIVISSQPVSNVECFTEVEAALSACKESDTWIIGGGQIYQASLHWVSLLDVTYVPDTIDNPEAITFPAIDPLIWQIQETSTLNDTKLTHVIYTKKL
jgi:dihydrofolate reductase